MAGGSERFDLCVIGAGPAGLAAAEKGLALGASTIVIEAVETGGVALNWGALPAQALAASARRAHDIRNGADLAIGADDPRVNFGRISAHIKAVIDAARPEVSPERLAAKGAQFIRQPAIFIDGRTIEAGERRIKARRFILAPGSRPFVPDIPGLDTTPFLTPETVFDITRRPGHLIVIGAGATGMALAQSHRRLGCEVTLIDMLAPLGDEDDEFSTIVTDRLAAEGVEIIANTGIVSASGEDGAIEITIRTGAEERVISGTHLLLATGRMSNIDTLDPGKARIKFGPRGPEIDLLSRTTNHRIYCVGDASGTRSVTAARFIGAWAAGHALGPRFGMTLPPQMPRLVLNDPEIAAVGMTEAQARARYKGRYVVTRYPLAGLDRALARGRRDGHVKIIVSPSGRIVGAGIAGENGSEIAAAFALAIAQRLTPYDLADLIVPYPALGEVLPLVGEEYASHHPQSAIRRVWRTLKRLLP